MEFLERYMGRPMQWGIDDCSLMLADWWNENHGVDPASHLRGTYCDEDGKSEIVEKSGGLVSLVEYIASRVGARPISVIEVGCFGVISFGCGREFSAIRADGAWAIRSETGITITKRGEFVRIWSIS